jgi:hypothetical protein
MAWTVNDVCQWIQSFGANYAIYLDSFKKDATDGYRLYILSDKTLIEFGIKNQDHRQTILNGVEQLKRDFQNRPWRN